MAELVPITSHLDDGDESDDEKVNEKWEDVYPDPSNFKLSLTPIENILTEDALKEIKALKEKILTETGGCASFEHIFDLYFGPTSSWFASVCSNFNEGLKLTGKPQLGQDEAF